ncbi:5-deoxy-glucuronate isomerase [Streptomyces sp. NBC_00443]
MTNREPHTGTNNWPYAGKGNGLYIPTGATADADYVLDIGPKRAGWTHSSLRIVELEPGGTHMFTTGDSEWIVLPLNGGCTVDIGNEKYQLLGRDSVFSGVTDFAYVPRDARAPIASGAGGRFALAGAKCERRLPARYGPAPEVPDVQPSRPRHVLRRPPYGRASGLQRGRGAGRRVVGGGRAVQEWRICFHPDHAEGTGGYR